jgi:hypothetical protein
MPKQIDLLGRERLSTQRHARLTVTLEVRENQTLLWLSG